MPDRIQQSMNMFFDMLMSLPSGILMVTAMLLSDSHEITRRQILLYLLGAVLTGAIFSNGVTLSIEYFSNRHLPDFLENIVTSLTTMFGFLTIVYFMQHQLVQKFMGKWFKSKTDNLIDDDDSK